MGLRDSCHLLRVGECVSDNLRLCPSAQPLGSSTAPLSLTSERKDKTNQRRAKPDRKVKAAMVMIPMKREPQTSHTAETYFHARQVSEDNGASNWTDRRNPALVTEAQQ